MDASALFLQQHGLVHSAAVGGNKASQAERVFAVTDEQMRLRPRDDLNSLAWLMWHIARAEDIVVNMLVAGAAPVFDEAWRKRLGTDRRDFGIGMTSPEVGELTRQLDLGALREYRDAVGRRTRDVVAGFGDADWAGAIAAAHVERAAAEGVLGARADVVGRLFTGRPHALALSGIALVHSAGHMGEGVTVRNAGGFGLGV
jgi:hypothetical protein